MTTPDNTPLTDPHLTPEGITTVTTATTSTTSTPDRKPRRVFMWSFLVVQLLCAIWLVGAIVSTAHGAGAGSCTGLSAADCKGAAQVGGGIAIVLILFAWAVIDIVLGVSRLVVLTARKRRAR